MFKHKGQLEPESVVRRVMKPASSDNVNDRRPYTTPTGSVAFDEASRTWKVKDNS